MIAMGFIFIFLGIAIIIEVQISNPDKTEMRLLIDHWVSFLSGFITAFSGLFIQRIASKWED